jgi:protoheme IX farnesyltransferase
MVFLWTPPHFWSLALFIKDDYAEVGYPMLPVVKGEKTTLNQILLYTIALVLVSMLPVFAGSSWLYLSSAAVLGAAFLRKALAARRCRDLPAIRGLFGYSIVYLFAICAALVVDKLILSPPVS